MRKGTFEIDSLIKAKTKLNEVIIRFNQNQNDDAIRDSVIQRFEFTYSTALKTIRKYFIEKAFIIDDINNMSFNEMIRTANQLNILKSDLETWTKFREMRNLTSHTYNEVIAEQVVSIIPDFYKEIDWLVEALQKNE